MNKKNVKLLVITLAEHYGVKLTKARLRTYGLVLVDVMPNFRFDNAIKHILSSHQSSFMPSASQILSYLGVVTDDDCLAAQEFLVNILEKITKHGAFSHDFMPSLDRDERVIVRLLGGAMEMAKTNYSIGSFARNQAIKIIDRYLKKERFIFNDEAKEIINKINKEITQNE